MSIYNLYHLLFIVFLHVKKKGGFINRILPLQLEAVSSQLNSNDAFILVTPGGSFLWVGVGASDTEKRGAQQLCDILGVSVSELSEGGETGEDRSANKCDQAAHVWLHCAGLSGRRLVFRRWRQCPCILKQVLCDCISLSNCNLLI